MNLISKDFFIDLNKKRDKLMLIYILLFLFFAICYCISFIFNIIFIPIAWGIISVVSLVLFYYGLIFDKNKLLKLYKNIQSGITQEDNYCFIKYDGSTEHDGVRLTRLICTFTDDNETFERTLYFLSDLPSPELESGADIKVKTYQNIIVDIEIK